MREIIVRQLTENDIPTADRICRLAFGTLIGLHHPMQFFGDRDPIRTRFRADPSAALAAESNGELVGSNFMADWGSIGFFGPLSVHPDLWNKGVAKQLLKSTMEYFAKYKKLLACNDCMDYCVIVMGCSSAFSSSGSSSRASSSINFFIRSLSLIS
jgi:predicted N-acetyltransferase YhbS